jgi:hypothetical protein
LICICASHANVELDVDMKTNDNVKKVLELGAGHRNDPKIVYRCRYDIIAWLANVFKEAGCDPPSKIEVDSQTLIVKKQ